MLVSPIKICVAFFHKNKIFDNTNEVVQTVSFMSF